MYNYIVPNPLQLSFKMNFADIIKQVEPTVTVNNKIIPVETEDKRIQNRLFLIQPETIPIQIKQKHLPPSPPRFNYSITDIIKQLREEEDECSSLDLYDEDEFSEYSGFPTTDDEDDFEEEYEE